MVGGHCNTIMFPEEFRNLNSCPYLKSAYEGMKVFPEWKTRDLHGSLDPVPERGRALGRGGANGPMAEKQICSHHVLPRVR